MMRIFALITALTLTAGTGHALAGGGERGTVEPQGPSHKATPAGEMPMGSMMGTMMSGSPMMGGHAGERPLITQALKQREQLGLSSDQVTALEQARADFEQDASRRQAEIQAAERGLGGLLGADQVDLVSVEGKIREIERLRADFRLARIKTLEKGKSILTPEQRQKLVSQAAADGRPASRGMEEMHTFMHSERAPKAMASMMEMARRMGDGDTMLGMVRMMEMMGSMGRMMGGPGHPTGGSPHRESPPSPK